MRTQLSILSRISCVALSSLRLALDVSFPICKMRRLTQILAKVPSSKAFWDLEDRKGVKFREGGEALSEFLLNLSLLS